MPHSVDDHSGREEDPSSRRAEITPLIDVVACDGSDTSALVVAAHGMGAEVRVSNSPEAWFDQMAQAASDCSHHPADVAALVGGGERMTTQRWVARGCAAAPDSLLLAAVIDASFEHAMAVVNQGARGLIVLPNSGDRVAFHLREVLEPAARQQSQRRAIAQHRGAKATLTPAEDEVLEGMLSGMPNKQIAQRLGIGLRTVELRRSKIMRKMKAKSLSQLISFICAAGHFEK